MRKAVVFLLTMLVVGLACAQAPSWTKVLPKAGNSTYIYCCEYAIGNTENESRAYGYDTYENRKLNRHVIRPPSLPSPR